eukprot:CAMPEP_0115318486 /NCGR_PEP_ID=MMETSP0270-20121206/79232_1 /TAXON_ID=71861 /ORGANISM="Scrippsiella trochoidea, Strain CCMP3099" /LENGTH=139 /DNA_ID=CAMNT_0002738063 /DNA_START=63 /DNA_END=479 /DNA_ORIENTATION=-
MSAPVTVGVEPRPAALDERPPQQGLEPEDQEILDPITKPRQEGAVLAKRLGSIVEPVALMDISKARGSELLDVYEGKLKAAGLQTHRFAKPTFSRPCPPTLLENMLAVAGAQSSPWPTEARARAASSTMQLRWKRLEFR